MRIRLNHTALCGHRFAGPSIAAGRSAKPRFAVELPHLPAGPAGTACGHHAVATEDDENGGAMSRR